MSVMLRTQFCTSFKSLSSVSSLSSSRHVSKHRFVSGQGKVGSANSFQLRLQVFVGSNGTLGQWSQSHLPPRLTRRFSRLIVKASADSGSRAGSDNQNPNKRVTSVFKSLVKIAAGFALAGVIAVASLPYLFSWSTSRRFILGVANKTIPGSVSVASVSLGWRKPLRIEGVVLEGPDGGEVLSIPKIESKAPLWLIALGKYGVGDTKITSPVIDLQSDPSNGLPRLALALNPPEKLLESDRRARKPAKPVKIPSADASLSVTVKSSKGGLDVADGKVILPGDVAAALGNRLFVDVNLGGAAFKESDELEAASKRYSGVPLRATLWSDCAQFSAVGFLHPKASKMKLIKPLKAEMDLTPAFAKFYLSQLNPLLGEILGPAVRDDDMPDIILQVTPSEMELPSKQYNINIAPMKVTLARGQVIDGILSLLSRQDLVKGKRNITMETSDINAELDLPGSFSCSRFDVLIADKVHVATWGKADSVHETVQMTLAIPGSSLRDVLGFSKVSPKYHLKIPVSGTFDKPKVDWKSAGVGIAQLTARERGGQLMQTFLDFYDSGEKSDVPDPSGPLPWEESGSKLPT